MSHGIKNSLHFYDGSHALSKKFVMFQGDITAVFGRISFFRTWLEEEMKEATVCRNGFDADAALPRSLNPRNWGKQPRPAVHTRINVGKKKRTKNKNKNKKGKKNKKE